MLPCSNLKLTENFRESGVCCKCLGNVFWQKSPLIRPVCIRFVHQVGAKSLLHVWCSNCISQAVASSRVRDPYLDLHCRMSRDCCAPHVSALRHMSSTAFWAQTESPKNYPLILRRSPAIESAVVIRSKWSIIQSNIFGCSVGLKSSAFSSAITIDRVVPVGFEHSQFKLSPNSVSICFLILSSGQRFPGYRCRLPSWFACRKE